MSTIDFRPLSVLILDDNPYFRRIMKTILRGFGVRETIESDSVDDAFDIHRERDLDFAFVDLMLPGDDGFEFVRRVRHLDNSPNQFLPIIMTSAKTDRPTVLEAVNQGVEEFLAKPVRPIDIFQRMSRIIADPPQYIRTDGGYFGPDRHRLRERGHHEKRAAAPVAIEDTDQILL